MGRSCLTCTVLVWDDENVLEADGGDGYVTVNVLNATELQMPRHFKMLKMANLMLYFTTVFSFLLSFFFLKCRAAHSWCRQVSRWGLLPAVPRPRLVGVCGHSLSVASRWKLLPPAAVETSRARGGGRCDICETEPALRLPLGCCALIQQRPGMGHLLRLRPWASPPEVSRWFLRSLSRYLLRTH